MYNPLLLIDFYKACHAEQYPEGMTMIYSPGTPRLSRLNDVDEVGYFGGQAFAKEYLIKAFNECFFNLPEEEVVRQYKRIMMNTLTKDESRADKIIALHRLGYLPVALYTVPEGAATKIGVPQSCFVNTHPDFAWLTNTLETLYSCYIWHIQVAMEVGKRYRKIVDEFVEKTCSPGVRAARCLGDFSMRGQHCAESAMKASAAWLLSFLNTATVPAILWLEDNYNCDCEHEEVGYGALSFEHSTVTSNYVLDGNEETLLKRALTEIYPNDNFSFLTDSYDHDNFMENVIPACKDEILAHNGTILFRGDSGDPVTIVTDMVFVLWQIFGGTVNEKGYKVLDKHVKAIYGDSITPQRCKKIYEILESYGFSIENVVLGVGSFSFMCLEEIIEERVFEPVSSDLERFFDIEGREKIKKTVHMNPYTRDTFGYAIKATYGEDKTGAPVMIYKQPKALAWKKSPKGCIVVAADGQSYTDGHTFEEAHGPTAENLLELVFKDGKMIKETSLKEIRTRMYPEGF